MRPAALALVALLAPVGSAAAGGYAVISQPGLTRQIHLPKVSCAAHGDAWRATFRLDHQELVLQVTAGYRGDGHYRKVSARLRSDRGAVDVRAGDAGQLLSLRDGGRAGAYTWTGGPRQRGLEIDFICADPPAPSDDTPWDLAGLWEIGGGQPARLARITVHGGFGIRAALHRRPPRHGDDHDVGPGRPIDAAVDAGGAIHIAGYADLSDYRHRKDPVWTLTLTARDRDHLRGTLARGGRSTAIELGRWRAKEVAVGPMQAVAKAAAALAGERRYQPNPAAASVEWQWLERGADWQRWQVTMPPDLPPDRAMTPLPEYTVDARSGAVEGVPTR